VPADPDLPYYSSLPVNASATFYINNATSSNAQLVYSSHYTSWNYSSDPNHGYLYLSLGYAGQSASFRITATNGTCESYYDVGFYVNENMGMYTYSPNPASDVLTVEFKYKEDINKEKRVKKNFEVKLINDRSKVLGFEKNMTEENKITLDTRELPNGTYFLHIIEGKNKIEKQIIIQH
jgi:hypothetical protein